MSLITRLLEQFIERPLVAFIFSVEILGQGLQGDQTIDGIVSRIIHTLSCPLDRSSEREKVVTTGDREAEREGSGSCKICE